MRTIVLLAASALATAAVAETEGNYRQNVYGQAEVDTSFTATRGRLRAEGFQNYVNYW